MKDYKQLVSSSLGFPKFRGKMKATISVITWVICMKVHTTMSNVLFYLVLVTNYFTLLSKVFFGSLGCALDFWGVGVRDMFLNIREKRLEVLHK